MGGLFNIDGPFYKAGTLIFDLLLLNFIWIIFSLPIFTIGASTTALFYVCNKKVNLEDGYLFRDFWKSFKMNFKQSTIVWLIVLLISFILYIDFKGINLMGELKKYFFVLLLVVGFETAMTTIYIFPVLSKFYIKTSSLIRTSFFMANKHLFTTICCILLIFLDIFLVLKVSFFMLFMFSAYAYSTSFLFKRVFDKYIPQDIEENNNSN